MLKVKHPRVLIDFYEKHLIFEPLPKNKTTEVASLYPSESTKSVTASFKSIETSESRNRRRSEVRAVKEKAI